MALLTIDNGDTGLSIRQKLNEIILKLPEIDDKLAPNDNLESLTNKADARTNLQLGTLAVQDKDDVEITGGSVLPAVLGWASASFGEVTQLTNKGTAVTLNAIAGKITTHAASLAAGARVSFTMTNSLIQANDLLLVNIGSGGTAGAYSVEVSGVSAGSITFTLENISAGALAEPVEILFAVLRAG
jgi:hypothetical protein